MRQKTPGVGQRGQAGVERNYAKTYKRKVVNTTFTGGFLDRVDIVWNYSVMRIYYNAISRNGVNTKYDYTTSRKAGNTACEVER